MKIGIPKELTPGERRVAATPSTVKHYIKNGFDVMIESQAGDLASFSDKSYSDAGAKIVPNASAIWAESDIILKVRPPQFDPTTKQCEASAMRPHTTLISFLWPAQNKALLDHMVTMNRINLLAMDCVPRISRAQKLDALSSMANIAGYRAVIEASHHFGRFFTGQITAAGKVPPAKVLVIGAGVAGLAAIGTAKALGATVRAFDTRPEVKEQIQSMGAEFLEIKMQEDGRGEGGYAKEMSPEFIKKEMELFLNQAKEVDIIITTALIPGKKAPTLITEEMVKAMADGSVIVDLAAEQGGNCVFTQRDSIVKKGGVTIIGYTDLPTRLPGQASAMYSNNIKNLIDELGNPDKFKIDMNDEMIRGLVVINEGKLTWPPPKIEPSPVKAAPAKEVAKVAVKPASGSHKSGGHKHEAASNKTTAIAVGLMALALFGVGAFASPVFLSHLIVFVLACFIGWQVIWNVTPALHTPLMSVTNAISGIIVLGGLLQAGSVAEFSLVKVLALVAILVATINVAGGFWVTQRMLKMFRKEG